MKKISIVIPMYYEEEVANECYIRTTKVLKEIKKYNYEIVFGVKNLIELDNIIRNMIKLDYVVSVERVMK